MDVRLVAGGGSYYIWTFLCPDTLFQHKETICMNLEFEKSSIFFFLNVLYFSQYFIIMFYVILLYSI